NSDRQNRVDDFFMAQRRLLHCAHQSERAESRTSRGRRYRHGMARSWLRSDRFSCDRRQVMDALMRLALNLRQRPLNKGELAAKRWITNDCLLAQNWPF